MKDTIESIVIALVLAFVFRAFVVEAFVIPTGSMAPTLYGAHATIICRDCGYEFAYGLRDPDDTRGIEFMRSENAAATCPNCHHLNIDLEVRDDSSIPPEKGDRILVLKWPFDLGGRGLDPARWDVIVFKDPSDGTTNFIKRCVGLPNEVLTIIDGDVYTVATSELSEKTRAEFESQIHQKHLFVSGTTTVGVLSPLSDAAFAELDAKLKIARKTADAQEILWFIVYDHDHPPQKLDRNQPFWMATQGPRSGWKVVPTKLSFTPAGAPEDYVALAGREIRAGNSYNVRQGQQPAVSDHRVRFVLTSIDGQGSLHVRLAKLRRIFWANISMNGDLTLTEGDEPGAGRILAQAQVSPFHAEKPTEIEFENVDYRLALRVDGKEVLTSTSDPDSAGYYAPDVTALRIGRPEALSAPPRIYATGGKLELTHLTVPRDVFYYHETRSPLMHARPSMRWAPNQGWASPESPIMLREGEYFMLGDNTAASKDSRLWDVTGPHLKPRGEDFQLGTVPRDQLIGRAFFVYWPSGHRVDWLPLLNRFGIIPDVGRMRWIR